MCKKVKYCIPVCLILVLFFLVGCTNKEYNKFVEDFNRIYLDIAQSVELSNTFATLKKLHTDNNKDKIEQLKVLLENIQSKVPKDKIKDYEKYVNNYKGLILLRDSNEKWEELSFEQKRKIWNEIHLIVIERDH